MRGCPAPALLSNLFQNRIEVYSVPFLPWPLLEGEFVPPYSLPPGSSPGVCSWILDHSTSDVLRTFLRTVCLFLRSRVVTTAPMDLRLLK